MRRSKPFQAIANTIVYRMEERIARYASVDFATHE
jgi:hypothetical protein